MKFRLAYWTKDSRIRVLELTLPDDAVVDICTQKEIEPEVNDVRHQHESLE